MGRTSKPLTILVDADLYAENIELFDKLAGQGHTVGVQEFGTYDVVLAPNAWRTLDLGLLDITLKAARRERYG